MVILSGECEIFLIQSHGNKYLKPRPVLQLDFSSELYLVKKKKDSTPPRCEGEWPWRSGLDASWLPLCILFVSRSTPPACCMQIRGSTHHRSGRGWCLFHFNFPLWGPQIFPLFPFCRLSPFLCLLAVAILDSFFYSDYPTMSKQFQH